jgi:hypothetical protein
MPQDDDKAGATDAASVMPVAGEDMAADRLVARELAGKTAGLISRVEALENGLDAMVRARVQQGMLAIHDRVAALEKAAKERAGQ